jgi:rhamnulokinase
MNNVYLAADFGGGSGRIIAGWIENGHLVMEEVHRFGNRQVRLGDHIYWDFPALFEEMKTGLKAAGAKGYKVKSIGVDTWGVDFGFIDKNGNLTTSAQAEKETSSEGNFIAFDLFVKSASPQKLKLNLGDSLSRVKGIIVGSDASNEAGTEKAVRVAFLDLGNSATAAGASGLKGNEKTEAVIWEPNSATRAAGVEAESGKLNYFGINSAFTSKALNDLGDSATEITDTFDETKDIVELETGINKIRVYIWLEGQDVDCVNEISFGDFSVNLAFSVPEEANT